jgi:hypothetical protein
MKSEKTAKSPPSAVSKKISKAFALILAKEHIQFNQIGDLITINHQGSVYLSSLTSLPEGTKFENQGSVDLSSLTSLPEGTKFENQGSVYLSSLTSLPEGTKFENQGPVYLSSLTSLPEGTKFENQGSVDLSSLTSLPEGTKFENQGSVDLRSLTSLPEGTKFENQGSVYLRSLTSLPEGTKFENQGSVDLRSLTSLPEGTKFENQGSVYLRSLTGIHSYLGKSREFKTVDGHTMIISSRKTSGEVTLYKARYFAGGALEKMKSCFIAQRGDFYAHGETSQSAISDVTFKSLQSTADVSDIVAAVKKAKAISLVEFRLLTGACLAGCHHFMDTHGIPRDTESLPLNQVLKLTVGAFGGSQLKELFAAS